MLHTIYSSVGLYGTVAVSVLTVLTFVTWWIALAGAVSRPMRRGRRVSLVALLMAVPPASIGYLIYTIVKTRREYRAVPVRSQVVR